MPADTHETPSRGSMPTRIEALIFRPNLLGLTLSAVLGIALMALLTTQRPDGPPEDFAIASLEDQAQTTGSLGPQLRGTIEPE